MPSKTCGSGPLLRMAVTSLNLLLYFKNNVYCTIHNINTSRGLGILPWPVIILEALKHIQSFG